MAAFAAIFYIGKGAVRITWQRSQAGDPPGPEDPGSSETQSVRFRQPQRTDRHCWGYKQWPDSPSPPPDVPSPSTDQETPRLPAGCFTRGWSGSSSGP